MTQEVLKLDNLFKEAKARLTVVCHHRLQPDYQWLLLLEKYDQAVAVQLTSRSGTPRYGCHLANSDEQILSLPFTGLTAEICQHQGAGVIVALQRGVLSVDWSTLKSPGLSAETCQH